MTLDKDSKHTATFRTERRKGLYMDLPPKQPGTRWGLVIGVAIAVAAPLVAIVWLIAALCGGN